MQFRQLITLMGLTISHVQSSLLNPSTDNLIRQLATLVTTPEKIIDVTPELHSFRGYALGPPPDAHPHAHLGGIFNALRGVDDSHVQLLGQSVVGFHGATDPTRRGIFRNSIYSRIRDIVVAHPETAPQHLQEAYNQLILNFQAQLKGEGHDVQQLQHLMNRLQNHDPELLKAYGQLIKDMPAQQSIADFTHMSVREVNHALSLTTHNKDLPPVNFLRVSHTFSDGNHAHAHSQIPVTPLVAAAA